MTKDERTQNEKKERGMGNMPDTTDTSLCDSFTLSPTQSNHCMYSFFYTFDQVHLHINKPSSFLFVCMCLCTYVRMQNKQNLLSKQIDLKGKTPEKGVLMSYAVSDLKIPLSYEVRLAPITTYSTGDYVSRIIQYSERESRLKSSIFVCSH